MTASFGPCTYLVGQVLPALLEALYRRAVNPKTEELDEACRIAIYIADVTLGKMTWPGGKPNA